MDTVKTARALNHEDTVFPMKWVGLTDEVLAAAAGLPPQSLRPVTAGTLLEAARETMEARAREYDKPGGERSVGAVVVALNAVLGRQALTEAEGYLFMGLLKNVRLFSAPGYHGDSGLDGVAYSALMAEAKAREGVR